MLKSNSKSFFVLLAIEAKNIAWYNFQKMEGSMQTKKTSNLNLPNALTLLRLLLIPVFLYLMVHDQLMAAMSIFIIASVTDVLDGWIARKYNLITDFGKLFDPLADKLMVLSCMLVLAYKDIAPWSAIIILLIKEFLMVLGGLLLLRKKIVVHSRPIGKLSQLITVVALVLCFFHAEFSTWEKPIHLWTLWTGVALGIVSLFHYAWYNGAKLFQPTSPTEHSD
jgi:cardiolipin synthase